MNTNEQVQAAARAIREARVNLTAPSDFVFARVALEAAAATPADPAPDPATVEKIAADRADWLVDAVAGATQNLMFLRGEPEEDKVATAAILLNAKKAITVAISRALASGKTK